MHRELLNTESGDKRCRYWHSSWLDRSAAATDGSCSRGRGLSRLRPQSSYGRAVSLPRSTWIYPPILPFVPTPGTSSFNNVNNICLLLRACLAGCVFVCLSVVYLAVCLLVLLPVCFFIWLLRCLLVKEFFMTFSALRHRSVHWSVHPSVHLSVCVSICPPSCLSCSSV